MTARQTALLSSTEASARPRRWPLLVAAVGFIAFYFATDFVVPNLAVSALPLPTDPAQLARAWFDENPLAAVLIGVGQFVSVCFLGWFVILVTATGVRADSASRPARNWGLAAMALMMVSSILAWVLAGTAATASLDTVSALRTANFIAGGTAHVVALGVFVWLTSRGGQFGKPLRVFARVAVVITLLSLTSLVWFYGSAFILVGRLLCMLWTLSAAISLTRRSAKALPLPNRTPHSSRDIRRGWV